MNSAGLSPPISIVRIITGLPCADFTAAENDAYNSSSVGADDRSIYNISVLNKPIPSAPELNAFSASSPDAIFAAISNDFPSCVFPSKKQHFFCLLDNCSLT